MMRTGSAIFFDGLTSARQTVSIELENTTILVRGAEGHILGRWPYSELDQLAAPEGMLRLGRRSSKSLARLEIHDTELAAEIDRRATLVDQSGATERRGQRRIVGWTIAATISLILVGIYGIPVLADQIAPLIPAPVEQKLGEAVDRQVHVMFDTDGKGTFLCGLRDGEKEGRAAFDKMLAPLERAAHLRMPLHVSIVRKKEANAFALPGGYIYVFQGLIDKAKTPDEVAGVLAHEIGHVANRDGLRSVLHGAGLSFMFGMLLGDFVGGYAVIIAAQTVIKSSYSRAVEMRADLYSVHLMNEIGADPLALAAILDRISGAIHPGMKILQDHPEAAQRVAVIKANAKPKGATSLLDPAEWQALKRVCSGS